jgi:hypothetical protein
MLHVRIPNLIYPNHPCTHIVVDQYEHLEANPLLSSLFIHKMILDPWEQRLNHAHSPLSCPPRQCCLPFFCSSNFLSWRVGAEEPSRSWNNLYRYSLFTCPKAKSMQHFAPVNRKTSSNLLAINIPILRNLTVVNRPWYVKESNWNCPVRTKAKYGRDIVVMRPAIVVTFLDDCIPRLLHKELQTIHCCLAVC